jgi:hypothetical protein
MIILRMPFKKLELIKEVRDRKSKKEKETIGRKRAEEGSKKWIC